MYASSRYKGVVDELLAKMIPTPSPTNPFAAQESPPGDKSQDDRTLNDQMLRNLYDSHGISRDVPDNIARDMAVEDLIGTTSPELRAVRNAQAAAERSATARIVVLVIAFFAFEILMVLIVKASHVQDGL